MMKSKGVGDRKSKTVNNLMSEIENELRGLEFAMDQKRERITRAKEGVVKYVSEIKSILNKK